MLASCSLALAMSFSVTAACSSFCSSSMVPAPFFSESADSRRLMRALWLLSSSSSGRISISCSSVERACGTSSCCMHTCSNVFRQSAVSASFLSDSPMARPSFSSACASARAFFSASDCSPSAASPKRWCIRDSDLAKRMQRLPFSSLILRSSWSSSCIQRSALRKRREALWANLCTCCATCASAPLESSVDFRSVPKVSSCFRRPSASSSHWSPVSRSATRLVQPRQPADPGPRQGSIATRSTVMMTQPGGRLAFRASDFR
mmetsp:Transcript_119567/g.333627  ORF Transcript_119567/g.333627 Transcript_119567/m.333627 type:complete len:262 (+) Transcript_119567:337-1122(+)